MKKSQVLAVVAVILLAVGALVFFTESSDKRMKRLTNEAMQEANQKAQEFLKNLPR